MVPAGELAQDLTSILSNIAPISQATLVRRNTAQATFCLPQNALGILFHGLLQLIGAVEETAKFNERMIVMTRLPVEASLVKTTFLHTSLRTESPIRHEPAMHIPDYIAETMLLTRRFAVTQLGVHHSCGRDRSERLHGEGTF
jgi:hypothetical protein